MKAINISICACGKVHYKHAWKAYTDMREHLAKLVHEELPKAKITFKRVDLPESYKEKKEVELIANYKGEDYKPNIIIKMSKCNLCEKEGTKYFEAIFQVRSQSENVLGKATEYIAERVNGLRQRGLFINKVDRHDDGFDLYTTSNKLTQVIGRELIERYGGEIKISPRLFSKNHQTSKDIYRVNVFVELSGFGKGDYIIYNERVYQVDRVGKQVKLIDMQNQSGVLVEYTKLKYTLIQKQPVFISKTYPHLEVINPHDYQSSMVRNNPNRAYSVGQTINVIIYKGIYVVD